MFKTSYRRIMPHEEKPKGRPKKTEVKKPIREKAAYEFIEFYPNKTLKTLGTIHIYLVHYSLDIRGIKISQDEKGKIRYHFPHGTGIDLDTGEKVGYPIISFTMPNAFKSICKWLHSHVTPILEKKLNP